MRPRDVAGLSRINGVGKHKAERFGDAFMDILGQG
jgi:hypothetical protein